MADDGVDVGRGNNFRGRGDDVGKQRLASDFVEDFRVLGFEARAFAGGHDGDGNLGCGHASSNIARVGWEYRVASPSA